YYHCQQQRHHPDKRSARAQRDDWLKKEIQRVYDENHQVYGVRKVWRQLLREGIRVARCTVARLMAVMGLAGVLRGKKVRTTISRKAVAAGDRVNRQFVAERPDQLWVADFTYVSTWQGHERDTGGGDGGLTTAERQRLKELERENRELRRSNDILRQASAYFAKAEFDRLWKK
ncbi:IS3 family transposase, partial [Escherichia coli]|nr:IS3 family transposase [Escherichia coli]